MFDFHEKRKIRSLLYSKVSIAAVLILAGLLSLSVFERYGVEREMVEKRLEKEQELEELKVRAAALEAKVDHLKNERGIEEEIRKRFDVAKEGEQVVIILDEEKREVPDLEKLSYPPGSSSKDVEEKSLFDTLLFWR